jgi:hypothetical protein
MSAIEMDKTVRPSSRTWIIGPVTYKCGHVVEEEYPEYGELLNQRYIATTRICNACAMAVMVGQRKIH